MKKTNILLITVLLLTLLSSRSGAQTAAQSNFDREDSIIEKLVGMALNGPLIKKTENLAVSSEYIYKKSKTMWLNNITAIGNLNEFSINPGSAPINGLGQSTQYPRYNVGIVVPLGIFINNPKQTKSDYYQYQAAVEQVNIEKQNIRLQVITLYEDYQLNKGLQELQEEIMNDYEVIHKKNEEKFQNGQLSLESYNASNNVHNGAKIRQATLLRDGEVLKARLSIMIGMDFQQALTMITNAQKDSGR